MSKTAADIEYLSDIWSRIDSMIYEQKKTKYGIARKCRFDRKTLICHSNLSLIYFARICEELNVSADFFLFGLEKDKEETHVATYKPEKCYKDQPTQQEIFKESKRLRSKSVCKKDKVKAPLGKGEKKLKEIAVNNKCGISAQKDLMTLADDFYLLHREDVREIIETCKSYEEGQQKIMRVYERVYM